MNEMQHTAHATALQEGTVSRDKCTSTTMMLRGSADKKSAIGTERLLDTAARCQGGNGRQREGLGWDNTTNPIAILVHRLSRKKIADAVADAPNLIAQSIFMMRQT